MRALLVLMLGAFVSQTTEYLPIGLLPQIAGDLQISHTRVGALVTGYAWIVVLTAIPFTLLTRHIDRRTLFLTLTGVITLSNGLAIFAHGYWTLALLRSFAALGHGAFWALLASYAVKIAPQMPPARATAWAFAGISAAIVGGIPLAAYVGQHLGWQAGFALFGLLGSLTLVLGYLWLPAMKLAPQSEAASTARRNWPLYAAAFTTLLVVSSHFNGYTYILPLLSELARLPVSDNSLLLLVFGASGILGTLLAGLLGQRSLQLAIAAATGIVVSQAIMLFSPELPMLAWLDMVIWGTAISALIIGLQSWVIELAPHNAEAASALYVTTFNLGIGGGALTGGAMLAHFGAGAVLWLGLAIGVAALASFFLATKLAARANA